MFKLAVIGEKKRIARKNNWKIFEHNRLKHIENIVDSNYIMISVGSDLTNKYEFFGIPQPGMVRQG